MQIAYLNKGKAKVKPSIDAKLELAYLRDIRRIWVRDKEELSALGLTEITFVARMKDKFREKDGLFSR